MASETEYTNYITATDIIASQISPVFRSAAVMPGLMYVQNFASNTDSIKLRKAGSVSATAATESTAHTVAEYTETSPNTLTAAEVKVYMEVSDKALIFGGAALSALIQEAGAAIAQKFDQDAMALFDAFNGGTAIGSTGADLTPALLLQASYTVRANSVPGVLAFVLHPVQVWDVQDDILASAAVVWSNESKLDILNGQPPQSNGFAGNYLGIPVYESTNTESLNTNADWGGACLSPTQGLAAAFAGGVRVRQGYNVSDGVTELGISLWYDAKEYNDLGGVPIVTDQ